MVNSEDLFARAWAYRDHGKRYDARPQTQRAHGFRWPHESWGSNLRMTEVQATVGRVQLRRLAQWGEVRRRNARILKEALSGVDSVRLTVPADWLGHAYCRYSVFIRPGKLKDEWNRDLILAELNARGMPCSAGGSGELYLEQAFPNAWRRLERLPVARDLGETSLTFLVHPPLGDAQMQFSARCLGDVLRLASR